MQVGFRKTKKPAYGKKPYPLKGKVVCGCCGFSVYHVWNNIRERWHYGYWKCNRSAYFSGMNCVKYLKDDYQKRRGELTERAGGLEARILETEEKLKDAERGKNGEILETLDVLDGFSGEKGLTAEMADALVKKVTVYAKDRIAIEWNFSESVYGFIMGE